MNTLSSRLFHTASRVVCRSAQTGIPQQVGLGIPRSRRSFFIACRSMAAPFLGPLLAQATLDRSAGPGHTGLASTSRLWLPSDLMYALRLRPGEVVLAAVAGPSGQPRLLADCFGAGAQLGSGLPARSGDYAVPAEAWPHPKLPRGAAALSGVLRQSLGSPDDGVVVLLYHAPATGESPACGSVCARLVTHQRDAREGNASGAAGAAASPHRAGRSPAPRQGRRLSGALSPSMAASSSGGAQPVGLATPTTKSALASARQPAAETAANIEATPEDATAARPAGFLDAVLHTSEPDSQLNLAVQTLLTQTLCGRWVLPGNLVAVPVLGGSAVFCFDEVSGQAGGDPAQVTMATRFSLDKPADRLSTGGAAASYGRRAADAAQAVVGGGEDGAAAAAAYQAARAGEQSLGSTFESLGGAVGQMLALRQLVCTPLAANRAFTSYGVRPPTGVLLHGPPGTGKTALARAAATEASANLLVLNGPDVVSEFFGESESGLRGVFAAAKAIAPCVIFIDEIDAIAPSRGEGGGSTSTRIVTTMLAEMDALHGHAVVVLAATNRLDAVDQALRRPGRFDREVEVPVPSPADRLDILQKMLNGVRHSLSEGEVRKLAVAAHGFVGADLALLCSEAAMAALRRTVGGRVAAGSPDAVTSEDFTYAKTVVRPSAMREVALEVPKVTWADVGGNEAIKQQLREAVEWPFHSAEALSRLGAVAPKGILLYGPPGCSKTMLARAVAAEAALNFLAVKGPELMSKFVGESEKALAALFKRARSSSPAIIFFDELDGMVGGRDEGGTSDGVDVGARVLSQMLQEMDGLQTPGLQPVIVIAATNRPDHLDAALLRPGRFDRLVYVPPPDEEARQKIVEAHTRCVPLDEDVNLPALAARTRGYTGADIAAVCQQAALMALDEDMGAECVCLRHFDRALQDVHASIGDLDTDIMQMYAAFSRQV